MDKCAIYGKQEVAEWAWQPFGPDEKWSFAFFCSHYRGFPVIKVSDKARKKIETGNEVAFEYRGVQYIVVNGMIGVPNG